MLAWTTAQWTVFLIPFGIVLLTILVFLLVFGKLRSRRRLAKELLEDPDIHDFVICFNWTRKVLYVPMIVVSITLGILTAVLPEGTLEPGVLGGIWLAVFFINFLVEEYELSVPVIIILVLAIAAVFLWLGFLEWVNGFLGVFKILGLVLDATAYFVIAGVYSLAVLVSWLRGLFYYVAITPNYINIQSGITETGEQVGREEYNTRVDTSDFLERLMGFGQLIITFRDHRRPPLVMLVGRVGRVARKLESVRGKLAVDRVQATSGGVSSGGLDLGDDAGGNDD